mmetsp:Transcript_23797/g.46757  ORF Transcript_23797/g.46757 Transcript_23797/m.46757 type:complete len:207 (-) Transcript_23797:283-903(-)
MCSTDEVEVMPPEKIVHHVGPESEGDAAVVLPPPRDFLLGVTPQEIAQKTCVGHVGRSDDSSDLVEVVEFWGEASVHTEDLLIDNRGHRQTVEAVSEGLPQLHVVPPFTFVIEAVDPVDRCALVVPPQEEKVLRVLDLVRKKQTYGLKALFASVHIIPQKEVVGFRGETTILKQPQQVVILPVDIPANFDRSLELQQNGLRDEDLS